jgi:HAD superfamily hydrolase (TIGR01509 family)
VTNLDRPLGLIFDLDGTLVDTVRARIDGWVEALDGAHLPVSAEQVGPMIGMDGKRLAREIARAAGRSMDDDELEEVDRAAGAAFDRLNATPRALPGVHELLAVAEERGVRWVIATSSRKEQVTASIAVLDLDREPAIVDGQQVKHAKPAPDLLLLAAKRLGLPARSCWAVGDSTWDVRAALAAGITPIGVTAGSAVSAKALANAGAVLVVETLGDLAGTLGGFAGDLGRLRGARGPA